MAKACGIKLRLEPINTYKSSSVKISGDAKLFFLHHTTCGHRK